MEELPILVIVIIGWIVSAIFKKRKQPAAKKPSQSGMARPVSPKTDAILKVQRMQSARPAHAPSAEAAQTQTVPVQQVFPGMTPQPAAVSATVASHLQAIRKPAGKARPADKAEAHKPLPHPESPANTQGGEGHEGPGEHPCLEYEELTPAARPRQMITPAQMRQAVVMSEILSKPVSVRRRCSQR